MKKKRPKGFHHIILGDEVQCSPLLLCVISCQTQAEIHINSVFLPRMVKGAFDLKDRSGN